MTNLKIYEMTIDGYENHMNNQTKMLENVGGFDVSQMFPQRTPFYIDENNIGHINVFGPLVRNASEMEKQTGITTYDQIINELNQSLGCDYVIMNFDSPGGESIGSLECAEYVRNHPVAIYGIVRGICASAALKIASSCTEIYATVSSEVGSIGSIIAFDNYSKNMNNSGVFRNVFTNSEAIYKGLGENYGDLSDSQKEKIQQKVDESGKKFQEYVKYNRPEIVTDKVFNADMFSCEKALEFGLIDGILN